MRILRGCIGLLLLLPTAFCGFGFLATFEPGPHMIAWRIGYAAVGLTTFVAAFILIVTAFPLGRLATAPRG